MQGGCSDALGGPGCQICAEETRNQAAGYARIVSLFFAMGEVISLTVTCSFLNDAGRIAMPQYEPSDGRFERKYTHLVVC